MTGIRFRELDGGSNCGLQNVIHGGSDLDQDLLHMIPPSSRSAIVALFHGAGVRFDHCRIDEESRLDLRRSQGMCDASAHICGENGTYGVPFWHSPRCAPQRKPYKISL